MTERKRKNVWVEKKLPVLTLLVLCCCGPCTTLHYTHTQRRRRLHVVHLSFSVSASASASLSFTIHPVVVRVVDHCCCDSLPTATTRTKTHLTIQTGPTYTHTHTHAHKITRNVIAAARDINRRKRPRHFLGAQLQQQQRPEIWHCPIVENCHLLRHLTAARRRFLRHTSHGRRHCLQSLRSTTTWYVVCFSFRILSFLCFFFVCFCVAPSFANDFFSNVLKRRSSSPSYRVGWRRESYLDSQH